VDNGAAGFLAELRFGFRRFITFKICSQVNCPVRAKCEHPQDVSPRRHCLETGIEGPNDARTGRKNKDYD
jgi:hypothetical protein